MEKPAASRLEVISYLLSVIGKKSESYPNAARRTPVDPPFSVIRERIGPYSR